MTAESPSDSPPASPQPPPQHYDPPQDLLAGRTVLVTGAGSGLGQAVALACARLGATVVLLGRRIPALEALYDRIEAAGGGQPAIYPVDLAGAKWSDYGALAVDLSESFGHVDGIVHAAAHFHAFAPLGQLPPREWLESLQVNLTAPYALTAQCLPLLDRSPDASVVFISDRAAQAPRAYSGAYGVAKYAQQGLAGIWAEELGFKPHLRFNCYDPGPMRTALRKRGYPHEEAVRLPTPESALPRLLWLVGPDSRGHNGETFANPVGRTGSKPGS